MAGFFPIVSEQVNDTLFRELTVIEKAYYWLLASEFNRFAFQGNLCLSDKWFASALGVSESKIRKSRREFKKNGWIEYLPGRLIGQLKHSTEYSSVRWAFPPEKGAGFQFCRMHRHAFNMLLNYVLHKKLTLGAVVVYVYLSYWRETKSNGYEAFSKGDEYFISKRQLCEITGLPKAADAISELYQSFQFSGGAHLFEFKDQWTKFSFTKWAGFCDPEDDETAQKQATAFYQRIKDVQMAAKPKPEKTVPTKKTSMAK